MKVSQIVLIVLLLVAIAIAVAILFGIGVIAKTVVFTVSSLIMIVIIKKGIMGNSIKISIADLFKFDILAFFFVEIVLLAIIRLYISIIYHH